MYECQADKCKKNGGTPITPSKQPLNKIVIDKRPKTYQRIIRKGRGREYTEEIKGWEIVKELSVCAPCYERMTGLKALTMKVSMKQIAQRKEKKPYVKKKRTTRYKKKNNFSNRMYKKKE